MRRSTFLTFMATVVSSSAFICSSAYAADAGTYRPGNAYNSITANSPDICDMQCSGDAQCRSWNFVRISEMSDGVCEFNDNISTPVPSAISISGNNVSRARSSSVVSGATNTVRVGAPSVTQSMTQNKTQAQMAARPSGPMPQTVRQAVPQLQATRPAAYAPQPTAAGQSLMEQQRMNDRRRAPTPAAQYTPPHSQPLSQNAFAPQPQQFQHSLEEGRPVFTPPMPRQATAQPPQNAPTAFSHADPRLQQKLQQRLQATNGTNPQEQPFTYPPANEQTAPQNYAAAAGGFSAPPGVPPLERPAPALGSPSYMSPSMAGAPLPPSERRVTIPAELSPRPMGSGDSLFGSLYDDVKVPRPVDPLIAADPNAPIPTVSSVPTAPIYSAPLPPRL